MESQRRRGSSSLSKPPPQAPTAPPPPAFNNAAASAAGRTTTTATRQHRQYHQQQVKVKHIVTTEVSTDEASFKGVVQSLTGKDSVAARAAVLAGGGAGSGRTIGRSNDNDACLLLPGGSAEAVVHNDETLVAGVFPSPEHQEMKWFWPGA